MPSWFVVIRCVICFMADAGIASLCTCHHTGSSNTDLRGTRKYRKVALHRWHTFLIGAKLNTVICTVGTNTSGVMLMKSVCVFCGSSVGSDPAFSRLASTLGSAIAERGIRLIYGGGRVGLMGVLADAALAAGGEVIGVMPQSLRDREIAHTGLSDLHITASMHERKAQMEQMSEGFIALPGGFGTLDEFCEIVTWSMLGYHGRPVGMLDANGYFNALRAFFDHAVEIGFVNEEHRHLILEADTPDLLLDAMASWRPSTDIKWAAAPTS